MLGGSLGFTDGKVLGYNEGILLGVSNVKMLGTILVNVYGIAVGIDVRTELESLNGYFDGSNYGNIEGLLIGDSL